MKKLRLFFLLISMLITSSAMAAKKDVKAMTIQEMETAASQAYLKDILSIDSFQNAEDCRAHKKDALMCANFVLDNPCESNDKNSNYMWIYCARYVLLWDEKSDEILISYPKNTQQWLLCTEMMGIFLAACTKVAIENNIGQRYTKEMHIKAVTTCVKYYIKHKKVMDMLCMPNMKKLVKKYKRRRLEKFLIDEYDRDYGNDKPQPENFFIPE